MVKGVSMNKVIPIIFALSFAIPKAYTNENLPQSEQLFTAETELVAQEYVFTEAELEQILAPIALYPDSLLTHILISATYPLEIVQANRWRQDNIDASNEEITTALEDKDWDPSVKALVPFTQVLERLNNDLSWTQKLGDAFLQNEALVLASIQSLRTKAQQAGTLDDIDNLTVEHDDSNIIIRSREPEVIYVPYYDTRVVYGNWHWAHRPPIYWDIAWHHNHRHHHYGSHYGHFSWFPSVHISFNYFFNAFHWHNRHVVVFHNHHKARYHYRYQRKVINHRVKRWHHNPTHRRGVAYRTANIKHKYRSNRPAITHSKRLRHSEKQLIASRQVSNGSFAKKTTNIHKHKANINRVKQTRHESVKGKLNRNTHQAKFGPQTKLKPSKSVSKAKHTKAINQNKTKSVSRKQELRRQYNNSNNTRNTSVKSAKNNRYVSTNSNYKNKSYNSSKQSNNKNKSYSSHSKKSYSTKSSSVSRNKSVSRSKSRTSHSKKER